MQTRARGRRSGEVLLIMVVATLAATIVPVSDAGAAPAAAGPSATGAPGFVATTPQRLVDTRIAHGAPEGPVGAGQVLVVDAPDDGPDDATGIALTVTSDQNATPGFVTAYPCGSRRPLASLLNPRPDEPRSNQLLLALDDTRQVCLYTLEPTHLIVDLTGWLVPGGAGLHAVQPFRALDTRTGPRPDGGTGKPAAGAVLEIPLAGTAPIGAGATAVTANITVTNAEGDGFVTAYPCGTTPPPTSTVNVPSGGMRASFTMVGLGSGSLCLFTLRAADLVVDVSGWFGPSGGDPVFPATPRRLLDTRLDPGGAMTGGEVRVIRLGLPTGTTMAAVNVTAAESTADGWAQLGPCVGYNGTSTVNFAAGMSIANLEVTTAGDEDSVCLRTNVKTHLVVDLAAASTLGTVAALDVGVLPLVPAFRPDILDYVVHCQAGNNFMTLHAAATPGSTVSVDGGAANPMVNAFEVLQPGQGFRATFSGPGGTTTYRVRCLPPDFPEFTARRLGNSASSWYVLAPSGANYVMVVDREGVPVWWYQDNRVATDAKVLPGQRLAWNYGGGPFNDSNDSEYTFRDLNGTVIDHAKAVGEPTDYHDFELLPNGNRLVFAYVLRQGVDLTSLGMGTGQAVLDAHIQEINPAGAKLWEWKSEDHFPVSETSRPLVFAYAGVNAVDLLHVNAISEDNDGTGIIVSARHLDAAFRIDKATGDVTWKLGGKPHAGPTKNLTFVNDPIGQLGAQHDARLLADGTLTIHDNRNAAGAPRAVRYALDIPNGTATLLEQITDPAIPVSNFFGSARRTAAGTWVINWGSTPTLTETDGTGKRLFELQFAGQLSYRGIPVTAAELSRDALDAGMTTQHPR